MGLVHIAEITGGLHSESPQSHTNGGVAEVATQARPLFRRLGRCGHQTRAALRQCGAVRCGAARMGCGISARCKLSAALFLRTISCRVVPVVGLQLVESTTTPPSVGPIPIHPIPSHPTCVWPLRPAAQQQQQQQHPDCTCLELPRDRPAEERAPPGVHCVAVQPPPRFCCMSPQLPPRRFPRSPRVYCVGILRADRAIAPRRP
jgi:hypothetical protein